MAKNINSKTSKVPSSRKNGAKSPIRASKVEATKFRLAGNHNETLVR